MSPHPSDAWIDDALKNVAVPGVVIEKLHAIASLDDAELDRALCDVSPRAELLVRLRSIGSLDDDDLNDELRHVVLPAALAERLRKIPLAIHRGVLGGVFVRRLAIAASLLIAMGVGYIAAVAPSYFGRQQRNAAGTVAAGKSQSPGRQSTDRSGAPATAIDKNADRLANDQSRENSAGNAVPEATVVETDDPQLFGNRPSIAQKSEGPQSNAEPMPGDNVVLGAGVGSDSLPPLESLPPPIWRGVTPPHDIGYDWMLQVRHRVHPFVSPARQTLAESAVPLVTSTESFDEALRLTADRALPPPHRIRSEEFLAAMDYGFSPPENAGFGDDGLGAPLARRSRRIAAVCRANAACGSAHSNCDGRESRACR
jgi:hypothetical protein